MPEAGKRASSQWEFGDLLKSTPTREVWTVSEVTQKIRRSLEGSFAAIVVRGEVTNLRAQSSGHVYFSIKDAAAQLQCVLFRSEPVANREFLKDGQTLVATGALTVYEARGQYQLRVTGLELQGNGALYAAFEKLKARLQVEGLFAKERKRPIPHYPARIGLITSPTGAAIRDVIHVIERRHPGLEILLVACAVQGAAASSQLVQGIRWLNEWSEIAQPEQKLDLILMTRGGGSFEDLWCFNDELLARAIFASKLPIVSAIGHEIDFTISDFVADLRAATPSAAGELITEGIFSRCKAIGPLQIRMKQRVQVGVRGVARHLQQWTQRLAVHQPRRKLEGRMQRLDELAISLRRSAWHDFHKMEERLRQTQSRLLRFQPLQQLSRKRQSAIDLESRLREAARSGLEMRRQCSDKAALKLDFLSPAHVLRRGYSITTDASTGAILRSAKALKPGSLLKTQFESGSAVSEVVAG